MEMAGAFAGPVVLRVVVAEDERPARELLVSALRAQAGVEIVAVVQEGVSLRRILIDAAVDVVFMDVSLPGREAVTPLIQAGSPIVILTSTDPSDAPPDERLLKPFTSIELEDVLRAARARLDRARVVTSASSAMWAASPPPANAGAAPSDLGRQLPREARARQQSRLYRGILGLALLWIVLYLLVLAPPGANARATVIEGSALNEALRSHVRLSFSSLSGFEYHPGMSKAQLPAEVRAAEGRRVAIYGFMLPIDVNSDGVSTFLLNSNFDMCMYGMTAGGPHQWVAVQMVDGKRAPFTHMPLFVFGTLDIGEQRQNGRVMSMYRLRADKVAVYDR
jgi:hypothetical protein